MKFTKFILGLALVASVVTAGAQGIDTYKTQRAIVLAAPTVLTAANATVTNGPIDIGGYLGIGYVDLTTCTNAGGALTATLENSNDTTNWTAVSNFSLISTTTSFTYTNTSNPAYSTNVYATNPYLLPGLITTPSAYLSGFVAIPYLNYGANPFTNSGAITVTAKGVYRAGFNVQDAKRYLHIVWTPTGSSSNDFVTATFNAVRSTEVQ